MEQNDQITRMQIETSHRKLADYCSQWLEQNKNLWKPSTVAKYDSMIEKHIKPRLGQYLIQEIASEQIACFSYELLYYQQLSVKTVRDILSLLHKIIKDISKDRNLQSEPVTMIYPKMASSELRVLTEQEQLRLMQYLNQNLDVYKYAVLLALTTGMRVGEICGLNWKNISLDSGLLKVTQTVQRIRNLDKNAPQKTILQVGPPKTSSSCRTIPFTAGMLERIQQFQVPDKEAYLLTGTNQYAEPRTLQRKLKQYTDELHLQDVHFHTLRHTFATRCVEVGCDIKTLSEILGHASISMTMNRYVHPSIACKKKNMEKLNQAGFGC